jgi:uncharacterized protein
MWQDGIVARLRTLEHPAWGPAHWRRLHSLCLEIAEEEDIEIDEDVIFACAWMHELGSFGQFACAADDPPTCAAEAAEQILPETGFPAEKIELVAHIIAQHSFEGEGRDTEEAKVLRDADMLEFLGSVGLMRLLSLVELEDWVPEPRAAIALAMQFADDLPGKLFYEHSRRLAELRVEETHDFVEALGTHTGQLEIV